MCSDVNVSIMLSSPSLCQHDVTTFSACGDDDDGFLLNYTSVLHMREEAAEAREQGDFETRPFFNVALRPNNRKYNSTFQLAGLHGSGGFIHAESKIKYFSVSYFNKKNTLVHILHTKSVHLKEYNVSSKFFRARLLSHPSKQTQHILSDLVGRRNKIRSKSCLRILRKIFG